MDDFSVQLSQQEVHDLIKKWGEESEDVDQPVIYGKYDNSRRSIFVRFNDYLIDHGRISLKEKSYFFYLLAVLVDAGVPIVKSLKLLSRRTPNQRFKRVISTMVYLIENGSHLSECMRRFPDVFSDAEFGVVQAGEAVGNLQKMLLRLAKQLEASYALHIKVRSALIYPALVVLTLMITGTIIVSYVIPQLSEFFNQSGATLPFLTRALIFISDVFLGYWWLLFLILLLLFVVVSLYIKTELGRLKWDYYKLRLPGVGQLLRKVIVAKFVRLLGVLFEAGISVHTIMEIIAKSLENHVYSQKCLQVKERIQRGERISDSLSDAPFLFPEVVVQMLYMGENAASLDSMCEKIARHYDLEVEHAVKNMVSVLEPVTIVLVALGVIFVAFAVMGPIFSLTDVVAGG